MGYQWRMRWIALLLLLTTPASTAPALADAPRRVVSFNLCADQLVLALADPEQIAGLSLKEFEFQGFLGKRRIVSFGWRYDFNGGGLQRTEDLPTFLLPVREQAAAFAGIPPERLKQVLLGGNPVDPESPKNRAALAALRKRRVAVEL